MSSTKLVRSTLALLVFSVFAMTMAPPADAQVRTKKRITGATTAAAPGDATPPGVTAAIHPDLTTVVGASDLIIRRLGFNGKGEITFELKNRGSVPINPAPVSPEVAGAGRKAVPPVPENKQIKVTVYLNNAPFRTVFQPRLGGAKSKTFTLTVPDNLRPGCAQSRPLRTVIDPANVIVEYTDTNNVDTLTAVRPCPDLAVESIKRNYNDWKTEYVARITLINKGNAPVESFEYLAMTGSNSAFNALPDLDDETGGPLAPGQTKKFNVGSSFANNTMWVRVWLDRRGFIEELVEGNNLVDKELD